ncbi:hypothetical protein GDO86_019159 [Hymenochirus boettgeri]|uniref:Uncharacterized protein n=1 Tax=Hymenochirus boettgeri TaxID=247094 RepID=A0A8T2IB72_9PIPI|nr:hypothetical protein GDO86_019159 [Hymenochirus boettgeri]
MLHIPNTLNEDKMDATQSSFVLYHSPMEKSINTWYIPRTPGSMERHLVSVRNEDKMDATQSEVLHHSPMKKSINTWYIPRTPGSMERRLVSFGR